MRWALALWCLGLVGCPEGAMAPGMLGVGVLGLRLDPVPGVPLGRGVVRCDVVLDGPVERDHVEPDDSRPCRSCDRS